MLGQVQFYALSIFELYTWSNLKDPSQKLDKYLVSNGDIFSYKTWMGGGGGIAQRQRSSFFSPSSPGFDSPRSQNILDVAEINRRYFLECGKFEYVDRTIKYQLVAKASTTKKDLVAQFSLPRGRFKLEILGVKRALKSATENYTPPFQTRV